MSSMCTSVLALEYQEAGDETLALPLMSSSMTEEPSMPVAVGVPEEEVERRIERAREAAVADAERRARLECERARDGAQQKVAEVIGEFSNERTKYFKKVEGEIVQLALSIARKILHREADLDPALLAALVRIALDRMQCGSVIRIRIAPENAELWHKWSDGTGDFVRWEIVADDALDPDDCVVETEFGTANFGFEAQLRDVEESFMQLLAHRPEAHSRHAARA